MFILVLPPLVLEALDERFRVLPNGKANLPMAPQRFYLFGALSRASRTSLCASFYYCIPVHHITTTIQIYTIIMERSTKNIAGDLPQQEHPKPAQTRVRVREQKY
jgi:hypothetical protein